MSCRPSPAKHVSLLPSTHEATFHPPPKEGVLAKLSTSASIVSSVACQNKIMHLLLPAKGCADIDILLYLRFRNASPNTTVHRDPAPK